MECVTTPTSATPISGGVPPNADVIITDESEVFTEGATVEIVETTPLVTPPLKSPKKKGPPPYRSRLLLQYVCMLSFNVYVAMNNLSLLCLCSTLMPLLVKIANF